MYNIYFGSFLTNDWNHAFPSPCLGPSLLSSSELEVTCLEQLAAPAFPKLMESSNSMLCYKNQNCVFIYNSVPRIRIQWAKISTKYCKKKLKTVKKKVKLSKISFFLHGSSSFSIKISEKRRKIIWKLFFCSTSVNLKEMFMTWTWIRIPIKSQWTLSTI